MDILHLNYFLAVAHHKSFTKASQALHISQPSISKSIRTLEDEWGVVLFHRMNRSVELTEAGQGLLPQIKNIVSQFQELNEQIENKESWKHGQLTIGIPPMVGTAILSPLLSEFSKLYPDIQISVEESGSNRIVESICDGEFALGYVALPLTKMPTNHYIFHDESLFVILPKHHPLGRKTSLHIKDIAQESFAFFTEDFSLYQTIMSRFQNLGVEPHIACKSLNWDFISEMVRANLGIALLPSSICKRLNNHDFHIVPLKPAISWRIAMVWSHDVFIPNAARLWIEFFKSRIPSII